VLSEAAGWHLGAFRCGFLPPPSEVPKWSRAAPSSSKEEEAEADGDEGRQTEAAEVWSVDGAEADWLVLLPFSGSE
jgi:hypothetical protein